MHLQNGSSESVLYLEVILIAKSLFPTRCRPVDKYNLYLFPQLRLTALEINFPYQLPPSALLLQTRHVKYTHKKTPSARSTRTDGGGGGGARRRASMDRSHQSTQNMISRKSKIVQIFYFSIFLDTTLFSSLGTFQQKNRQNYIIQRAERADSLGMAGGLG